MTGTPPEALLSGFVLLVQKQLAGEIDPDTTLESAKDLLFIAADTPGNDDLGQEQTKDMDGEEIEQKTLSYLNESTGGALVPPPAMNWKPRPHRISYKKR